MVFLCSIFIILYLYLYLCCYNTFIQPLSILKASGWGGSARDLFFVVVLFSLFCICICIKNFITALFILLPHLLSILTASGWGARPHDLFSHLGNIFHRLKIPFCPRKDSKPKLLI